MALLKEKLYLYGAVIAMAAILLLVTVYGYNAGKQAALSKAVAANGNELAKGLELFYADQDRFPTATEFASKNVMDRYFFQFPLAEYPSETCAETYKYQRLSSKEFSLSFCLPKSEGEYRKGWNTIQVGK